MTNEQGNEKETVDHEESCLLRLQSRDDRVVDEPGATDSTGPGVCMVEQLAHASSFVRVSPLCLSLVCRQADEERKISCYQLDNHTYHSAGAVPSRRAGVWICSASCCAASSCWSWPCHDPLFHSLHPVSSVNAGPALFPSGDWHSTTGFLLLWGRRDALLSH
jgi:hypothetical protein